MAGGSPQCRAATGQPLHQRRRSFPHRRHERLRGRAGGVRGARGGEDRAVDAGRRRCARSSTPGWRPGSDEVGQQRHGQPAGHEREADASRRWSGGGCRARSRRARGRCAGSSPPSPCPRGRWSRPRRPARRAARPPVPARRRVARGQDHVHRSRSSSWRSTPAGSRQRLVLPLVAEHEVDVAERERGQRLLGLGLDAARSAAAARRAPAPRSPAAPAAASTDWKPAIRPRPATVPAAAARSASASAARSSSASACSTSTSAASVRRTPRPARSSSAHAGLALEHGELLRDGRGRELERVGDGGDRPALAQLAQQPQAPELEHREETLLNIASEIGIDPDALRRHDAAMRSSGTLLCLGSAAAFGAMAVFGKLAYDDGATVGTLLAVRFAARRRCCSGRSSSPAARRRELRALRAPRPRASASRSARCGYAIQAGCYFAALERIDASLLSLLLYTFPAMVAAAAIALGRERIDARRVAALVLASGGLALVRGRRRRGRARPAGRGARRSARRWSTAPTSSSARASPGALGPRCSPRSSAAARP